MASSGSAPRTDVTPALRRRPVLSAAVALVWAAAAFLSASPAAQDRDGAYFPPRGAWEARDAAALGFDQARLDEAVAHAIAHENPNDRDLRVDIPRTFRREAPYNALIGPATTRGGSSGLIIRHGRIAAEWGDTARPDMTFSVTKSFLSTVVGVAFDRGLIESVDDRAGAYMPWNVDLFHSEKNAPITWDHLLRQTSDWQGTLWGKPDWADRPVGETPADYPNRPVYAPGTHYKYNDVRVNVLALAAMHVWRRPLPEVLRQTVMEPIGASSTWRWEGYDNSWVEIDGVRMQASTGGGHWGGGMFISAHDMARFGYLFLRNGRWNGDQLISEQWIGMARTPGPANADYGYMNWFLNTDRKPIPSAPATSVTFRGNGQNIIYIDWENDLVVVVRWLSGPLDDFFSKVIGAIEK